MFASSQGDKAQGAASFRIGDTRHSRDKRCRPCSSRCWAATMDNKGKGNAMMRGPGGAQKAAEEKTDVEVGGAVAVASGSLRRAQDRDRGRAGFKSAWSPRAGRELQASRPVSFGRRRHFRGSYASLEKVAAAIGKIPNPVRLEGHTDSRPISTTRFRSNWELSAARSIALMEILTHSLRCADASACRSPAMPTPRPWLRTIPKKAARCNRRVDIVILNEQGIVAEPPKVEETAAPKK